MRPLYAAIIFTFLFSCSNTQNSIQLTTVRKTSDLIHCDKIFGKGESSLDLLNEIIIQTGQIDTTDERKQWVAVIHIKNSELILNQTNIIISDKTTTEQFEADGYKLTLHYDVIDRKSNYNIYKGKAIIINNKKQSEFTIIGEDNLGYL
jgi:hypothetical protein